ncbi:MAG: hypothetical protein JWO92_2451 [Chitinophagaceae bacterium]|nr:hypothetical protein [Chitinophagaceae bacterium]
MKEYSASGFHGRVFEFVVYAVKTPLRQIFEGIKN